MDDGTSSGDDTCGKSSRCLSLSLPTSPGEWDRPIGDVSSLIDRARECRRPYAAPITHPSIVLFEWGRMAVTTRTRSEAANHRSSHIIPLHGPWIISVRLARWVYQIGQNNPPIARAFESVHRIATRETLARSALRAAIGTRHVLHALSHLLLSMFAAIDLPSDLSDSAFLPRPDPRGQLFRSRDIPLSLRLRTSLQKRYATATTKFFPSFLSLSLSLHRPLRVRGFFFDGLIPAAAAAALGRSLLAHSEGMGAHRDGGAVIRKGLSSALLTPI